METFDAHSHTHTQRHLYIYVRIHVRSNKFYVSTLDIKAMNVLSAHESICGGECEWMRVCAYARK